MEPPRDGRIAPLMLLSTITAIQSIPYTTQVRPFTSTQTLTIHRRKAMQQHRGSGWGTSAPSSLVTYIQISDRETAILQSFFNIPSWQSTVKTVHDLFQPP